MIASLPMYDRPETAAANDRLWQGVRERLGQGPEHLTRGGDLWAQWQSPDLILGPKLRGRTFKTASLCGARRD